MPSWKVPFGQTAKLLISDSFGDSCVWHVDTLWSIHVKAHEIHIHDVLGTGWRIPNEKDLSVKVVFHKIQLPLKTMHVIHQYEESLARLGMDRKRTPYLQLKYARLWQRHANAKRILRELRLRHILNTIRQSYHVHRHMKETVIENWREQMETNMDLRRQGVFLWRRTLRMRKSYRILLGRVMYARWKSRLPFLSRRRQDALAAARKQRRHEVQEFVARRLWWSNLRTPFMLMCQHFRVVYHILCNLRDWYIKNEQKPTFVRECLDSIQARSAVISRKHMDNFQDRILFDVDSFIKSESPLTDSALITRIFIPCLFIRPFMALHTSFLWFKEYSSRTCSAFMPQWFENLLKRTDPIPSIVLGMILRNLQMRTDELIQCRIQIKTYPKHDELYSKPRAPIKVSKKYKPTGKLAEFLTMTEALLFVEDTVTETAQKQKLRRFIRSKVNERKAKRI